MMRKKCQRSRDRGAVAVEMAIVTPLLVALIFGIIDFSRIFNAEIQLSQAAREGVRIASLASSKNGWVRQDVRDRATLAAPNPGFTSGSLTVQDGDIVMCNDATKPSVASVTVQYTFKGIVWFAAGSGKTFSQNATMTCGG